ncbi:MBL fold metallo-hydrolase [Prevotella koreensis]|uniref:MBL fold metallo-hydrolase n=1 Tax=Prevotella koreensis TaxID=2490854 RepID=UPI0028E8B466|nr:MBL fold metallo-hydrolase [Prevotella koreensis]
MIKRFFHPVGQGAFYSERHIYNNINIVYDCGTEYMNRRKRSINGVVTQSFRKDDVIHILFISHFDFDHISLINKLKNTVKKIEKVVIPLLQKEEKNFLYSVYKALGESNLANLVNKPNDFFGTETRVFTIQPSSGEEISGEEPIFLDNYDNTKKIPSVTPLTLKDLNHWFFIPFNYEYPSRNKIFLEKLEKEGIDIECLKNDSKYLLERDDIKKKIKDIYKKIEGGINQNSMFLYSGPLERDSKPYYKREIYCYHGYRLCHYHRHCDCCKYYFDLSKVACLYTGDGDLNIVNVRKIYKEFWDLIGTIQIPHHGSLLSFNENVLERDYFLCPISVGKNNSYGHPSNKVIGDIKSNGSCPIIVTEDVESTYVEKIIFWLSG